MIVEGVVKDLINKCLNEKLKISILQIQRRTKLPFAKAKELRNLLLDNRVIDVNGYVLINEEELQRLELN